MTHVKRPRPQPRRPARGGIDWEAVRLAWGVSALVGGVGALITWGTLTAPPGPGSANASKVMNVPFQIAQMLPRSVSSRIAAGLGALMILFALVVFVMGVAEFFRRRG